jgi:hypothetical protein
VVLYGYETRSLPERKHILKVFVNRVLRRKKQEDGENCIMMRW